MKKTGILLGIALGCLLKLGAQTPSLVICKGSSINYSEFNTGGSLQSVSWFWTFQGGMPAASTLRNPSITYPDTGMFLTTCQSTFEDSSKQTKSIWVQVILSNFDPIPMRDTTLCGTGVNLGLNAGNRHPGFRYHWTSSDVNLSGKDTNVQIFPVTQPGTYSVKVWSVCGSSSKTVVVKQGVKPTVELGGNVFVCRNAAVTLDAGTGTGYTYAWLPNNESSQTITANLPGTYTVTVTSPDGCTATDNVLLIDSCPPVFHIPNAFTPNGYAPNDIFKPYLDGITSIEITILNRWGQKVFETKSLTEGWDGTYMGKPAQEGVYACLIEMMGTDQLRRVVKTNITLLR
ncbi:MAG: gliding motility-associated C-terminal domain-containing protein [Bacteroidetes bacterium]|nr:gliding motility-associated C-terminal domain-containing protein [Bacteroidota bacterium]